MGSCLILVSDEKLARAVRAALTCAGIAAVIGDAPPKSGEALVIADEKSVVPDHAAALIALYREERWLRSDTHTAWSARFGNAYAVLRRPFLFMGDDGLTGIAVRLLDRSGTGLPAALTVQPEPTADEIPPEAGEAADASGDVPPGILPESARIVCDPQKNTLTLGERTVRLTERELALFSYFQAHADEIVTREELREAVWHDKADPAANVTDVYVSYLRGKLSQLYGAEEGAGQVLLASVRGKGYRFRER